VLSNTLPPGKYTVEYHISQSSKAIRETVYDLRRTKPRYFIILPGATNFPFNIGTYKNKFIIEGADIYEKSF
jgi:hypothetical protein